MGDGIDELACMMTVSSINRDPYVEYKELMELYYELNDEAGIVTCYKLDKHIKRYIDIFTCLNYDTILYMLKSTLEETNIHKKIEKGRIVIKEINDLVLSYNRLIG
jgi:hypothetical protein